MHLSTNDLQYEQLLSLGTENKNVHITLGVVHNFQYFHVYKPHAGWVGVGGGGVQGLVYVQKKYIDLFYMSKQSSSAFLFNIFRRQA